MIPMSEAGNDDALEVGEDRVEALAAFGRARGQRVSNLTRRDTGKDRIALGCFEVIRDPVREAMRLPAEIVRTTDLAAPP